MTMAVALRCAVVILSVVVGAVVSVVSGSPVGASSIPFAYDADGFTSDIAPGVSTESVAATAIAVGVPSTGNRGDRDRRLGLGP